MLAPNSPATLTAQTAAAGAPLTVNDSNFIRAESDLYFSETVKAGGFGKLYYNREMTPIDKQTVVRMNRDTLYSAGVFDLDAAPVTITLPDPGKRLMSMEVISEDHYAIDVVYAPGRYTYTKDKVGTRYVLFAIRTLADPENPSDLKAANALQDEIMVEQASTGTFEVPNWDSKSQGEVRDALAARAPQLSGSAVMFGTKTEVDPTAHLIGTAIGWGGNPPSAAVYNSIYPKQNDGSTVYRLRVDQCLQCQGIFRKERSRGLLGQQRHGEAEPGRLVHGAVRWLREGHAELHTDHARLELHGSDVPAEGSNSERKLAVSGGVSGCEHNACFLALVPTF
jgi:para-nitrobenzyl esterase